MNAAGWWKNRAQAESGRDLVQREVDSNLAQLQEFWKKVKPRKGEEEAHRVDKVVYAREFAITPLPAFSRQVYLSQQSSGSKHLAPAQIEQLGKFYTRLDRIAEIQQELRETRDKDIAAHTAQGESASLTYDEFLGIAPWSWMEAARLIQEILTQGNPLK